MVGAHSQFRDTELLLFQCLRYFSFKSPYTFLLPWSFRLWLIFRKAFPHSPWNGAPHTHLFLSLLCFPHSTSTTHSCSVTQSLWILCDPMDCSLPVSSVHGISQARILEWVAISSSRGSSWPQGSNLHLLHLLHWLSHCRTHFSPIHTCRCERLVKWRSMAFQGTVCASSTVHLITWAFSPLEGGRHLEWQCSLHTR